MLTPGGETEIRQPVPGPRAPVERRTWLFDPVGPADADTSTSFDVVILDTEPDTAGSADASHETGHEPTHWPEDVATAALRRQVDELTWQRNEALAAAAASDERARAAWLGRFGHAVRLVAAQQEKSALQARNTTLQEENRELVAKLHETIYDKLTNLIGEGAGEELLEALLQEQQLEGWTVHVHALDLNKFKAINDTFGHPAGDTVLVALAEYLALYFQRIGDFVIRPHGDEFYIITVEAAQDTPDATLQPGTETTAERRQTDPELTAQGTTVHLEQTLIRFKQASAGFLREMSERTYLPLDPKSTDVQNVIKLGLGLSIGHACSAPGDFKTAKQVLGEAEAAMFAKKLEQDPNARVPAQFMPGTTLPGRPTASKPLGEQPLPRVA